MILDVVFNHTGESDDLGPTLSLRGLDNALYFRHANGALVNDTGCGNTLALDSRPAVQLVTDAMRSFVTRCGIDGFRFDLAPVLGRRATGFDPDAPFLAAIEQDPLLSKLIMIAEPWDIGPGGYQLGNFPARWLEWNDRYRDTVRRFWRGDDFAAGEMATRITGSSDVFASNRRPSASVNFIAAHDGFTLKDAVTFATKDNFANGEQNRDGNSHEPSWPGGDARALLATLFLSRGTPMLTAGDEFGRSQRGNNNAYAQDNAITWLDWDKRDETLIGFTAALANLRKTLSPFLADRFLTGAQSTDGFPDAEWVGGDGEPMRWDDPRQPVLGLLLTEDRKRAAILFNRGEALTEARLPKRGGHRWDRIFCSAEGTGLPASSVAVFAETRVKESGVSDDAIRALASAAGVQLDWWEVDGTHHDVPLDSLRHMLGALRLPHANSDDLDAARRTLSDAKAPLIADARGAVELAAASSMRQRVLLRAEDGTLLSVEAKPGEPARISLGAGYYDLLDDEGNATRKLIVGPGECYLPDDIAQGTRVFGIASHLYALRHDGSEGIGDFETLKRLAGMTERVGGRYAGLNPLHHLFPSDRSRASPYQPSDRRFVDPIYISIADLLCRFDLPKARALANESRAAFAALDAVPNVDYAAVWQAKSRVLEQAFADFGGTPDFYAFMRDGGSALFSHGLFESQRMKEDFTPPRIAYRAFLQWVAEMQLAEAAQHRNLYCDLALGCAFDGGEMADMGDVFAQGVSIGAPPDPFSRNGQVWNLPPFSPAELARRGCAPMRDILSANMRHAAALRIDHILGFWRQFWVPRGAEGKDGAYIRFPTDALLAVTAIESMRNACLVVGEDLGTVPDGLRDALHAARILSYRVLWFEREGQGFRAPQHYPKEALACLASHDLPTFMGWRAGRDIAINRELGHLTASETEAARKQRSEEVRTLERLADAPEDPAQAGAAVHAMVASTPSQIMLAQADDLAGEIDPLNVPGTDTEWPNWRRRVRVPVESLAATPLAAGILAAIRKERAP